MANIKKDNQNMEFPLQIARQYPAPIDKYSVFYTMAEAEDYAKNSPLAYVGQTISIVNETDKTVDIYKIGFDGTLDGVGTNNEQNSTFNVTISVSKALSTYESRAGLIVYYLLAGKFVYRFLHFVSQLSYTFEVDVNSSIYIYDNGAYMKTTAKVGVYGGVAFVKKSPTTNMVFLNGMNSTAYTELTQGLSNAVLNVPSTYVIVCPYKDASISFNNS